MSSKQQMGGSQPGSPTQNSPHQHDRQANGVEPNDGPSTSGGSAELPVASLSEKSTGARPKDLPIHGTPIPSTSQIGSFSPLVFGEVCPQARRQVLVLKDSKMDRVKRAPRLYDINESIEMASMESVICEGDEDLDEIMRKTNLEPRKYEVLTISTSDSPTEEPQCWLFLPLCPGQVSIYDCVANFARNIITCAPVRCCFRFLCGAGDSSEDSEIAIHNVRSETFERDIETYMERNPEYRHDYLVRTLSLDETAVSIGTEELRNTLRKFDAIQQIEGLHEDHAMDYLLVKMAEEMCDALSGEVFRLYRVRPEGDSKLVEVYNVPGSESHHHNWEQVLELEEQCLEAMKRNSIISYSRRTDPLKPSESSKTVFFNSPDYSEYFTNMILMPLFGYDEEMVYMIEIWRGTTIFKPSEMEIARGFMTWSSFGAKYFVKWMSERRHNTLNNFLLTSVKAVFEDMLSIDKVVKRTLQYAQTLVNADRASLFMLDKDNEELVSRVFDLRGDKGDPKDVAEIRIPVTRGIAGHVACTGQTVNIANAYNDDRFNQEVDEATGYRTTSILCMPVKVDRKVIGVVQLVNKRSADHFSADDERSLDIFSAFFGLALHNAGVYDIIARNEQKYKVALDVLSYHNTCREHEVSKLRKLKPLSKRIPLDDFYLNPFKFNDWEKCQAVIVMFDDLFTFKNFDCSSITRFILTVKKNYRDVPYHNFHHGWSVAQSMYAILKADVEGRFSYKQRLALFVASLCHDLDHRGYTNQYMSETASPLASMYTTSTLEHHHFAITVTILQQDDHNIFQKFDSQELKEMLGLIKTCILATDLAAFFPNMAQLQAECSRNFEWTNPQHSKLAMALSMTAADLSAAAKPWDIQIKTVKVIFEEFYEQGDKERMVGRKPIPMMDRNQPQEQPASQVGFITTICLPCYKMLKYLLPKTDKMYQMATRNLEIWEKKAAQVRFAKAVAADERDKAGNCSYYSEGVDYDTEELSLQQALEEINYEAQLPDTDCEDDD